MLKKFAIAAATATIGIAAFAGPADAAPRDGKCVAANVKVLGPAKIIPTVATSGPGAVSRVIQSHLDGTGIVVSCAAG